jgi:hypothetical protein
VWLLWSLVSFSVVCCKVGVTQGRTIDRDKKEKAPYQGTSRCVASSSKSRRFQNEQ